MHVFFIALHNKVSNFVAVRWLLRTYRTTRSYVEEIMLDNFILYELFFSYLFCPLSTSVLCHSVTTK